MRQELTREQYLSVVRAWIEEARLRKKDVTLVNPGLGYFEAKIKWDTPLDPDLMNQIESWCDKQDSRRGPVRFAFHPGEWF